MKKILLPLLMATSIANAENIQNNYENEPELQTYNVTADACRSEFYRSGASRTCRVRSIWTTDGLCAISADCEYRNWGQTKFWGNTVRENLNRVSALNNCKGTLKVSNCSGWE